MLNELSGVYIETHEERDEEGTLLYHYCDESDLQEGSLRAVNYLIGFTKLLQQSGDLVDAIDSLEVLKREVLDSIPLDIQD